LGWDEWGTGDRGFEAGVGRELGKYNISACLSILSIILMCL